MRGTCDRNRELVKRLPIGLLTGARTPFCELASTPDPPENAAVLSDRPIPGDIDLRLSKLAARWAEDEEVAAVYLFGSRGRGDAAPRSDIDLAVVLAGVLDGDARWRKRMELLASATQVLATDAVDAIVLEDAPIILGHRVLRDGRLLCERDPRRRTAVAETIMRRYLDEEYLRAALDRALSARLREGRFAD